MTPQEAMYEYFIMGFQQGLFKKPYIKRGVKKGWITESQASALLLQFFPDDFKKTTNDPAMAAPGVTVLTSISSSQSASVSSSQSVAKSESSSSLASTSNSLSQSLSISQSTSQSQSESVSNSQAITK